ncbi:alpha-1A adrenergic receptor-like [Diadema antillarum]|uniref:alpha-1A adrenergic receptor-like n=1 Tax=Diadema antillarum TaxID=105358 RepID=UPI003A835A2A
MSAPVNTPLSTTELIISSNSTGDQFVSDAGAIVMSVLINVIAMLGIVGNSIVIFAVIASRKLRTVTNVFVIALSITDLLVCLTLPFQTVALTSTDGWPLVDWLCAAIGGITSICFGASVLLLVLIAVNRFCVITRPRQTCQRFYKVRNLALMVSFAYLYPLVMFAILPAVGIGQLDYSRPYRICKWDDDHPKSEVNDYIVAWTFGVSFIVIMACYAHIYVFVRRHHSNMTSLGEGGKSQQTTVKDNSTSTTTGEGASIHCDVRESSLMCYRISKGRKISDMKTAATNREVEITRNMFIVICSFFVCIAPSCISLLLPTGQSFSIFTSIFLMSNICINPIIYSFKHPLFKVVIRCMIRCRYSDIPKPSPTLKKLLDMQHQRKPKTTVILQI